MTRLKHWILKIIDEDFYLNLEKVLNELNPIVKIYNKTRNFVTKSLKQERKIKLNFDCSVLMDGWTESVEKTKNGLIEKRAEFVKLAQEKGSTKY